MSDGNGTVTVTINGRRVETHPGRLLIDVAEELGIFVPRFCYHPGMRSVAVCRMCLVHVEGQRKLMPACATPVSDGMEVQTDHPRAVDAQSGMLEFLLINHPLDCPICDRAGECPLQDQTYAHGPGTSRYVEPKRTYEKALEISDLVVLDRERCVLCWRCVRFADEIAGDRFIQLVDRGAGTQILTFSDEPFDSYFSGNTIQICPVGALTAKPYRFVSRPWDLKTAPSICAYCSVGCPISNEARAGQLVRCQALPNENVNDFWICDKGRFGYHYVDSPERLDNPLVRKGDSFEVTGWAEALRTAAEGLRGAASVGVIAGGHLTTEDAYAVQRLARGTLGTADLDSRIQDDGAPYELMVDAAGVAGSTATLNDLESAQTIVWTGPDPREELPVLFLRLRKAVTGRGAKLVVVSPRRLSLDAFATHVVRCEAGAEAAALEGLRLGNERPAADDVASADALVCCWGPSSPGRDETPILEQVVALAAERGGKVLVCPPHAGSQGLLDMGVHPALSPGYRRPETRGRRTREILEAAASGEIDALVIAGADVLNDFPDAELARRALTSGAFVVVSELFATDTARAADVLLPAAAYAEREGTFTNLERRLQKLEQLLAAPGTAREVWRICAGIAAAMGDDWGWTSFDDVWADINASVPTHAEVDVQALTQPHPVAGPHQESGYELMPNDMVMAGPGGPMPKGHRSGAAFEAGQAWPLSWELRSFEAHLRPGLIPVAADGTGEVGTLTERASATRREPGTFRLLSGRHIYDEGTMVSRSAMLHELAKEPFVALNAADAAEIGLSDGAQAVVEGATSVTLPVVIDDIARGAVYIPYDQPGLHANTLMRGPEPTVTVRPA